MFYINMGGITADHMNFLFALIFCPWKASLMFQNKKYTIYSERNLWLITLQWEIVVAEFPEIVDNRIHQHGSLGINLTSEWVRRDIKYHHESGLQRLGMVRACVEFHEPTNQSRSSHLTCLLKSGEKQLRRQSRGLNLSITAGPQGRGSKKPLMVCERAQKKPKGPPYLNWFVYTEPYLATQWISTYLLNAWL